MTLWETWLSILFQCFFHGIVMVTTKKVNSESLRKICGQLLSTTNVFKDHCYNGLLEMLILTHPPHFFASETQILRLQNMLLVDANEETIGKHSKCFFNVSQMLPPLHSHATYVEDTKSAC